MREVWTVSLNGEPDEVTTLPGDGTVSACAWSDDGLVAFSSQRTAVARGGFTSSPAIYVMHVDHPERHAQLCGGHEQAVSQLNWVHRQLGVVLMSADERSYICIWKPVQGLINRWELHHRLQFSAVKLAQFLNQPLQCTQPPPYFPGNEPQLNAYDAAVNPPPVAGAPPLAYGAKYGADAAGRTLSVAGGVNATPADKKDLQNIPGCLALLAVSRLGELKVFVQLSQGSEKGGGGEWVATSVNLSSHVLPDTTSRSVSRGSAGGSEAGGSGSQAVLCVEAAIVNVRNGRNGSLLLAVSQQSQILLFAVKCTYWPLKVTATPHTRTQLKSDIRLQGLAAPKPMLSPHLLHMCFNPTRPDDLLVIYRMTQALETVRGGHLRLERLRLKEKAGVQSAASTDPAQRARAGATAVEAWQWVLDARMLLTDGAEGGDATVTHLSVTRDGQFLVLFWASGTVQLRLLDSLQQPPTGTYKIHLATPVRSESAGKGAGKIQEEGRQKLWGAVMASCGPGSGNCLLLIDACGKAKLVELPHPWSGAQQVSSVANHLVQQFEIAVYKSCDCWDVLLALGGLLLSDPRAPSLIEAIVQQLHSGYARLPGAQQRVFQPSFDAVVLRVSMLSCAEEHRMLANNTAARLQLTYLEDCFRFYHAIAGTSVEGLCDAAHDRLQARRGEIMARIGQSLVALTLWFLYQAIKIHSWRSTPSQGLANAAAGEAVQPGGAVGGGQGGGIGQSGVSR